MRFLLPSVLLCALPAPAQFVSPAINATAEGISNNVFPFGSTIVPFRFAQVHDGVPIVPILRMAFRHNFAAAVYPAHTVTCDAWISTAFTTAATMSTTFDQNHGQDRTQVVFARTFNHPASAPNVPAAPFALNYPLDVPFVFGGVGSLCWEVQVTAKTQTVSIVYDATSSATNNALQVGLSGTGCLSAGRVTALRATSALIPANMNWAAGTGTLTVTGVNAKANGTVLHVLGFNNTNYAGIPLPFELPGTNGAASGPCYLYSDIQVVQIATASAIGAVSSSIAVPATPDLNGLTTYSQLWGLLESTNPLGITTSNVVLHHWVAPMSPIGVSRVYLSGSLGATGTLGNASSVLVTLFTF